MAKLGISIKIDVTKLDKARFFKGAKGTYADLTTFIDLDNLDQYDNNGFISQSVTKEERDQNIQTAILGNCKVFYNDSQNQSPQQQAPQQRPAPQHQPSPNQGVPHSNEYGQQAPQPAPGFEDFDDDIPFN